MQISLAVLTKRFRDSREKRPEKTLPFLHSSIIDGNGNAGTFRNVVNGDGDYQSYPKSGSGQTNDESGDALGEVVDSNSRSCHVDMNQ